MRYPHLWARLYGSPLLIWPEKAKVIEEVFRAHLAGTAKPRAMEDDYPSETPEQRDARIQEDRQRTYSGIALQQQSRKPYALTTGGVALIPILGTLVQRGSWLDSYSGLTSYDSIAALLDTAVGDADVRAILLELDSPGGEGAGIVEMAARVQAAGKAKPTWALANEQAYSAAYWIASAAGRVHVPITGGVGSIGAVALHVDQSRRDKMMGYTYTFVYAGARKVDMTSHQPLADRARERIQLEVDRFYAMFVADVARHRAIGADQVKATEAGLLTPTEALAGKFIDAVATLRETVALLEAELQQPGTTGTRSAGRTSTSIEKDDNMTEKNPADNKAADQPKHTDAQLEAARAEAKAAAEKDVEAKLAAARAEGVRTERARAGAILGSEEAKGRANLALHLALQTDSEVEAAKKLLAAASKESAGAQVFAAAMASLGNPKVGTEGVDVTAAKPRLDTRSIYDARRQSHAAR